MMESFAIIATALQTVQDVIAAAGGIHDAIARLKSDTSKGVREVDCRELELQLEVAVAKIKRWQDLFFLETDKSEDFFQALWGQTGYNRVLNLLQSISNDCTAIQESLKNLTEVREELLRRPNAKRPDLWQKLLNILRLSTKRQSGKDQDTKLWGRVASLSDRIDELWNDSALHFRLLHGVSLGKGQSHENEYTNSVLSHALRSREPAARLYSHCQSLEIELYLDLNLLNHDREVDKFPDLFDWSDLNLGYHFLYLKLSNPAGTGEFLAEPWSASDGASGETHGFGSDLRDSLKDAVSLDSSNYTMHLPASERAQEAYFHVTSKSNTWRQDVEPTPLSFFRAENHDKDSYTMSDQPVLVLHEKISLAYEIVQCGLFLLGTPWLSHLSSQTLLRFKISESEYQHRLHIEALSPASQMHDSRHTIERLQLFRIGVVLVDIALETNLSSTDLSNATIESALVAQVGTRMGVLYKQACEFCLNNRVEVDDPWEEEPCSDDETQNLESKLLISQYYMEVFMR